jgi:hypothetical protein
MSIKEKTIERLVNQLANLGCEFKVITEDGTEYGELNAVSKKHKTDVLKHVDYKTVLANMKAGDVEVLVCPEGIPLESLRSSISGHGASNYGAGTFTTMCNKDNNTVEVLRLE